MQDNQHSQDNSCVSSDYIRSLNTDQKILKQNIYLSPER